MEAMNKTVRTFHSKQGKIEKVMVTLHEGKLLWTQMLKF